MCYKVYGLRYFLLLLLLLASSSFVIWFHRCFQLNVCAFHVIGFVRFSLDFLCSKMQQQPSTVVFTRRIIKRKWKNNQRKTEKYVVSRKKARNEAIVSSSNFASNSSKYFQCINFWWVRYGCLRNVQCAYTFFSYMWTVNSEHKEALVVVHFHSKAVKLLSQMAWKLN